MRNSEQITAKNIDRDIRKNQLVYSYYLLKFVIVFIIGLLWVRLGIGLGPVTALPLGLLIGLVVVGMERFTFGRRVELCLLVLACVISYLFPVGLVL